MGRSGKTATSKIDGQIESRPILAAKETGLRAAFLRRPVSFFYGAVFLAIAILGIYLGALLLADQPQVKIILSDVIEPALDLSVGIALVFTAKYVLVRSKRLAIAWGMIALGMLLFALGGIAWFVFEIVMGEAPFPSIADGFYLAFYLAFLAGTFFMLEKPATTGLLISRILDICIALGAAVVGFWKLLIGPMITSASDLSPLGHWVLLAYPVGDLILIWALLQLFYNPFKDQERLPILLLAGGLVTTIVTDTIYSYQSLLGTYASGGPLDSGWMMATLLFGLAGLAQVMAVSSPTPIERTPRRNRFQERFKGFRSYLPYLWLVLVIAVLGPPNEAVSSPSNELPLSYGVALIFLLVIIRQIVAISENNKLNIKLQESVGKVQTQAAELEKTNLELQNDIVERRRVEAAREQSETLFRSLFELSPDAILLIDPHHPSGVWPILDCNVAACQMNGYSREELVGQSIDIINLTSGTPADRSSYIETMRRAGVLKYEATHRHKNGTTYFADVFTTLLMIGERELIVGIDHNITERKLAEEEIKRRLADLEAINKVSSALRAAHTLDEMLPKVLDNTLEVMHAAQGSIWLYNPIKDELEAKITRGYDEQSGLLLPPSVKPGKGIAGRVFASGQPYIADSFQLHPDLSKATRQLIPADIGGAAIPIRALNSVIGTLIVNVPLPRKLTSEEVNLLTTLSDIAGSAIRRATLRQQTDLRMRQLIALSEIDRAITSSFDLHLNLNMLISQVITQLDIDAADVLLFNPNLSTLDYAAGNGFRTAAFGRASLHLGEGYAGRAALERQIVHVPDLPERDDNPRLAKALVGEGFISYYGVPLMAKGQIKGVLEVFHRAPLQRDAEWLEFLNTLAGQAAIAIDNATLFVSLQQSNLELAMAYDATIEGWSHALDLRDKETEGHTQRVTDMTVGLARIFGMSEAELAHVRWGALLHDIGKMGVPDGILFKPGPLTDEEWVIMKKHPVFAYEMLSPIQYLRQAIDIPYYHHEKWDGTGYPLGLKGEQIPLVARIFAVVDVWDALRSDRPYRPAWPVKKVYKHIRSLSGIHFDPQVVKVFLESETLKDQERQ